MLCFRPSLTSMFNDGADGRRQRCPESEQRSVDQSVRRFSFIHSLTHSEEKGCDRSVRVRLFIFPSRSSPSPRLLSSLEKQLRKSKIRPDERVSLGSGIGLVVGSRGGSKRRALDRNLGQRLQRGPAATFVVGSRSSVCGGLWSRK